MTITLTREEAQQVLDAFLSMGQRAYDAMSGDAFHECNIAVSRLCARLAQPEPEPVAQWEPQVERRYSPDGVLLSEKVKYTPDGEWRDLPKWRGLTTAETKALWNATKKPTEFAEMLQAKLKEKNAAD
jgi:hypothetical protein